jgi:hypothetical protein
MNDIVTIDLGKLDKEKTTGLVLAKDGSLALEAENELKKILETRDLIEKVLDFVKERLGEEMTARKLIKVKGGSLTISKRVFGSRYSLGENPNVDFTQPVNYLKPNIDAIDAFVAEKGELPSGINLREREEKISIVKREEDL